MIGLYSSDSAAFLVTADHVTRKSFLRRSREKRIKDFLCIDTSLVQKSCSNVQRFARSVPRESVAGAQNIQDQSSNVLCTGVMESTIHDCTCIRVMPLESCPRGTRPHQSIQIDVLIV